MRYLSTLTGMANNLVPYFKDLESYDQKALEKFVVPNPDILIQYMTFCLILMNLKRIF